jgi:hypothetical protein
MKYIWATEDENLQKLVTRTDCKRNYFHILESILVVKLLGHKPEGRGLETIRGEILNLH